MDKFICKLLKEKKKKKKLNRCKEVSVLLLLVEKEVKFLGYIAQGFHDDHFD